MKQQLKKIAPFFILIFVLAGLFFGLKDERASEVAADASTETTTWGNAAHRLGLGGDASTDASVVEAAAPILPITYQLSAPITSAFGDPAITGITITSINLDLAAGTAQVFGMINGGSQSGPPQIRSVLLTIPPNEVTTLQSQVKAGLASTLGVTFQ